MNHQSSVLNKQDGAFSMREQTTAFKTFVDVFAVLPSGFGTLNLPETLSLLLWLLVGLSNCV